VADEKFTSSVELERAKSWQAVDARLHFMSSMTEALISKGFKSPVLWDHRIKDYHNSDFDDKEFPVIVFAFGLYTNLCTDMQNGFHVIT
jgi:hypothetical protein